jgi:hypothetical protein
MFRCYAGDGSNVAQEKAFEAKIFEAAQEHAYGTGRFNLDMYRLVARSSIQKSGESATQATQR